MKYMVSSIKNNLTNNDRTHPLILTIYVYLIKINSIKESNCFLFSISMQITSFPFQKRRNEK